MSLSTSSGYVYNWQAWKTVTECNLHMLTTEDCSDVIFRVGSEKQEVRAHRYVLVSRSCVFHAMFCGPLAEKGEITIPDIEHDIFKEFIRYMYTDTITITVENVTGLLYTSRKYALDALLNQCVLFLENSLQDENVCQILEKCHHYSELDLEQELLMRLCEAGEELITTPGFLNLCSDCFEVFMKSGQLNLTEERIFEAALSWAKAKCVNDNVIPSPGNVREYLRETRYEIRFSEFSLDYLKRVVQPSGVLTKDELWRFMARIFDPRVKIAPFRSYPNKGLNTSVGQVYFYVLRYLAVAAGWACGGRDNAISFSVSSNILLVGCRLYGPVDSIESTFKLKIILYDEDHDLVIGKPLPNTSMRLRGQRKLNEVVFPHSILLVAGRTYTLCVAMTGANTYYGLQGQRSVKVDGVTFTFKDSKRCTSGTSTISGQIPGLMWTGR